MATDDSLEQAEQAVSKHPAGTSGSAVSNAPSVGKTAHVLDRDRPVWERQPQETKRAYDVFIGWRDSQERNVTSLGGNAKKWSAEWSWGYRAFEWDLYLSRREHEDLVRYRLEMNDRQRKTAYAVQQKVIRWLHDLDVTRLKPADAARWWDLAVKVERMAAGANTEQVGVTVSGSIGLRVEDMSAEEVEEALASMHNEIENLLDTR